MPSENFAYLRATMTSRNAIVGRRLLEVFPDDPGDHSATGVHNLKSVPPRVLEERQPDTMPLPKAHEVVDRASLYEALGKGGFHLAVTDYN